MQLDNAEKSNIVFNETIYVLQFTLISKYILIEVFLTKFIQVLLIKVIY